MDRDIASALPEAPPPSPARREAAIAAALRVYDGEPAAAQPRATPKAQGWRVGPRAGTAIAAILVLLIGAPTAWLSIRTPDQPEPRTAPAPAEKAAEAPAAAGTKDAVLAEAAAVEPPAPPGKASSGLPSKSAAKAFQPPAKASEPAVEPEPPAPPPAPAVAEYRQQSADQARIVVSSQMQRRSPPAAAAPPPADAGNIVVTGSRITAENKLARRSEGLADPSRPIAAGSSGDMNQLARIARQCGLRHWRVQRTENKQTFYLDAAELASEPGSCFSARQAKHRFSPQFTVIGTIDAP